MIAYIEGRIQFIDSDRVIVLVSGIGYSIFVPERLLEQFQLGANVILHTHQHVREDSLDLYGFSDQAGLCFFQQLITVSGVGPRLALTVLSQLPTDEVKRAIIHGDITTLTSVSGVGKKTAERIILDLKESIGIDILTVAAPSQSQESLSVMDALLSLGYDKSEALLALQGMDAELSVEEQIRTALKNMAKG